MSLMTWGDGTWRRSGRGSEDRWRRDKSRHGEHAPVKGSGTPKSSRCTGAGPGRRGEGRIIDNRHEPASVPVFGPRETRIVTKPLLIMAWPGRKCGTDDIMARDDEAGSEARCVCLCQDSFRLEEDAER
jgi:hypothetical protein